MNLWEETIEKLQKNGYTFDDVIAIYGEDFQITNENFEEISTSINSDKLSNLSIVWEEITRAKEPINYYKIEPDDVYWFDLIKPFKYSNKNGKRYDFFYVFTSHNMAWNYFDLFVTFDQMKKNSGRLRSFYADEYGKVKAITFLGIEDGVNKLYGGSESNPTSIVFYGGYIQSN